MQQPRAISAAIGGLILILAVKAFAQFGYGYILPDPIPEREQHPGAEFQMARVKYRTLGGGGSHGLRQPWWAIDYPYAEEHFFGALRRVTNITVSDREMFLELSDDRIFGYPFLFLQAVGVGNWSPTAKEAANLRQHLIRGGFMLVDDFHGERDWAIFQRGIQQVFPDREVVEIPENDPLMHIFYDLDEKTAIPGDRHLRRRADGEIYAQMQGPAHWRAIYDDQKRIMVAINFNIDMGDSWEHADDAFYPVPMTALGYKFGVNYVVYAMTH
jgi:hypothetical protein